jgi:ATP-dependent RNA helicase DDX56/DBP9
MFSFGQTHFEARPQDLHLLRHDKPLHQSRGQAHLKHVPTYLLPEGARPPKEKVWAPYNKPKKDGKKKQGRDPMKSFKA